MTAAWLWWSTGKDSAWCLGELRAAGEIEVTGLVTTVTPTFGRVAIHGTRLELLRAQAAAAGLPLHLAELPYPCSNAAYESAVAPVLLDAAAAGVDAMAFGDLYLEDVRAYRERLLADSGLRPIFPIWGRDTGALARAMVDAGVVAWITSLDPDRLDPGLAGRRLDRELLDALPDDVDPCGERGEFHTCVTAGPMLRKAIGVRRGEVVTRDGFVYADLCLEPRTETT